MATRSTIALLRDNGEVVKVYSHWDGYLECNGEILFKYYNTPEKVEALLALGDISSLDVNIGEAHPFGPDYNNKGSDADKAYDAAKEAGWTTFYGRDRGEHGTGAKVYKDLATYEKNAQFEEYNYLYMYGNWYYKSYDGIVRSVEDGLAAIAAKELKEAA